MSQNKTRWRDRRGVRWTSFLGVPAAWVLPCALTTAFLSVQAQAQTQTQTQIQVQTPPPTLAAAAPAREWRSPPAGDVQRGLVLYQARCTACHAVDSNNIGPAHRGVVGRRVGSLPGYKYSEELARSRLRWTPQTLNVWLEDPEELVAGQRMGFQGDDLQERADLIAYLLTLK